MGPGKSCDVSALPKRPFVNACSLWTLSFRSFWQCDRCLKWRRLNGSGVPDKDEGFECGFVGKSCEESEESYEEGEDIDDEEEETGDETKDEEETKDDEEEEMMESEEYESE